MRLLSAAAALGVLVLSPLAARANAGLTGASPSADSVAQGQPDVVVLDFNQGVQAGRSTVTVSDSKGQRFDSGGVHVVGDNKHIAQPLKALLPGSYVVKWSVIGVDTHMVQGSYGFTVAQ